MKTPDTKLPLVSRDVAGERRAQLRELFPEAFVEGKLDPAKLRQMLGEDFAEGPERYAVKFEAADLVARTAGELRGMPEIKTPSIRVDKGEVQMDKKASASKRVPPKPSARRNIARPSRICWVICNAKRN